MLRNLLALLAGIVLLVLGFMFSLVVFAVVAMFGLAIWGYLMWKTRKLRRTMREQPPGGTVIDGEAVVVEEYSVVSKNVLPSERRPHEEP